MRIIGGDWRGRPIAAPPGKLTRPTTDRMRESLASMVLSAFELDLSEVRILDAFAGSGAIGLELLSRGAKSCCFVERDGRAQATIRKNIATMGASNSQARLVGGDVFRHASIASLPAAPFSLVMLDPPYAMEAVRVGELLQDLIKTGQLAPEALIVYERDAKAAGLELAELHTLREKQHGTTTIELLRYSFPAQGEDM